MANNSLCTTGLFPLTINSNERFLVAPTLNGLPWSLTGGTVVLKLINSAGTVTSVSGTVASAYEAYADWTVTTAGTWTRVWDITDSLGRRQVSTPLVFTVVDPLIP